MILTNLLSEVNMSPSFSRKEIENLPVGLIGFEIEGIFSNIIPLSDWYTPEAIDDEDYGIDLEEITEANILELKSELLSNNSISKWIMDVTQDNSIKVSKKDETDKFGAEVITHPIPSKDALRVLEEIFAILTDDYGLETNQSTGFHINISNIYTKQNPKNVDIVKLMLFLGEAHELDNYGRSGNRFAVNLRNMVVQYVRGDDVENMSLIQFADYLNSLILKENNKTKYLSFNPRTLTNGYLEFRIAGGTNYHEDLEKIINSTNRYVRCLYIACKPEMHKKEYMAKLSILYHQCLGELHPNDDSSPIHSIMRKLNIVYYDKKDVNDIKKVDDLELFYVTKIINTVVRSININGDRSPLVDKTKPFFNTSERKILSQIHKKYTNSRLIILSDLQTFYDAVVKWPPTLPNTNDKF